MKKNTIAVIGGKGFVGSALCEALAKNSSHEVVPVTRENYQNMRHASYEVLINAAMPSGRFWAKNHPDDDYRETVQKTADLLTHWKYKKFVHISTVSARCDSDSVYGRHKAEAEKLCARTEHLIIRLSALYGPTLAKGALIDILNRSKVFVSGESRYPFASLSFIAEWLSQNLQRTGLIEVGARNTVTLQEVANHFGAAILFEGPVENQALVNPETDFPDARDVFKFMESMKVKKK